MTLLGNNLPFIAVIPTRKSVKRTKRISMPLTARVLRLHREPTIRIIPANA
ncbi:MAG: hypothetical protein ACI3Y2_05105 [Candidatus Egerieousia sp.]